MGIIEKIAEAIDRIEKRLGTEQTTVIAKWKVEYVKTNVWGKDRIKIHEFITERTSEALDKILEDKPVELKWKAKGQEMMFEKTNNGFIVLGNGSRGHRYEIIITDI